MKLPADYSILWIAIKNAVMEVDCLLKQAEHSPRRNGLIETQKHLHAAWAAYEKTLEDPMR